MVRRQFLVLSLVIALTALLGLHATAVTPAQATGALKLAIFNKNMKAATEALKNGADVNAWNSHNQDDVLPLVLAVLSNKVAFVDLVLKHGAHVNANSVTDPNYVQKLPPGTTYINTVHYQSAITAAASLHSKPILLRLLKAGANINARDLSGATVLSTALMNGGSEMDIAEFLFAHGFDLSRDTHNQSLIDASFSAQPELIRLMLAHGARANGKNAQGTTPLISAACGHNAVAATILLRHGAKVNDRDKHGLTALAYAERGRPISQGPNDAQYPTLLQKFQGIMLVLQRAGGR